MVALTDSKRQFLQLRLDTLTKQFGPLRYEDALACLRETESWLRLLPEDDVTYRKFHDDRQRILTIMELICQLEGLRRYDHCHPVKVLYLLGEDLKEKTFYVSLRVRTLRELMTDLYDQIAALYPQIPRQQLNEELDLDVLNEDGSAWTDEDWTRREVPWPAIPQ